MLDMPRLVRYCVACNVVSLFHGMVGCFPIFLPRCFVACLNACLWLLSFISSLIRCFVAVLLRCLFASCVQQDEICLVTKQSKVIFALDQKTTELDIPCLFRCFVASGLLACLVFCCLRCFVACFLQKNLVMPEGRALRSPQIETSAIHG